MQMDSNEAIEWIINNHDKFVMVDVKQGPSKDIIESFERHAKNDYDEYVNPRFLDSVLDLLEDYYNYDNDVVHEWVVGMYGL